MVFVSPGKDLAILIVNIILLLIGGAIIFVNYKYYELPTVILVIGYVLTSFFGLIIGFIVLLILFAIMIVCVSVIRDEYINGSPENSEENPEIVVI